MTLSRPEFRAFRLRPAAWSALVRRAVCSAGIVLLATPAVGQPVPPPQVIGLRVGFDDNYRLGLCTPVEIILRGGGQNITGRLEFTIADGDGTPSVVVAPRPVQLLAGQTSSVRLYARFGQESSGATVTLWSGDRAVLRRDIPPDDGSGRLAVPVPMPSGASLVVNVGPLVGADDVIRRSSAYAGSGSRVVQLFDVSQLPTQWYGYEGVDVVVLSTTRPEIFAPLTGDSARLVALRQWIERGGRLLLCAGSEARAVIGPGGPLAPLAPGRLVDMEPLPSTRPLETLSGSAVRIPRTQAAGQTPSVPLLAGVDGVVLAAEGKLPLVVRQARGFGYVTFVGVDLDRSPFSRWAGRTRLVARLLDAPPVDDDEAADGQPAYSAYHNDLVGQLRSALDQFQGIRVVPFALVALLVLGYIVLIGPADYLFLRYVVRRVELTWLTFPAIVLTVAGAAYLFTRWIKGDQLLVNQAEVVDVDLSSGLVRGTLWANVFSPQTASYDLTLDVPQAQAADGGRPDVLLSWLGRPGFGYGGMNDPSVGPRLFARGYRFLPGLDGMQAVPIQVWSSKSFRARWTAPAEAALWTGGQARHTLAERADGTLEGSFEQPLPVALSQCLLLYGRWAYEVGEVVPRQTIDLARFEHRDAESLLKRVTFVQSGRGSQLVRQATPYDTDDTNVLTVLKRMLFYEDGGGYSYTRLANRQEAFVDLSQQLKLGRAILMGVAPPQPVAQLQRDGRPLAGARDQHWVIYRVLFPVARHAERPSDARR